MLFSRLLLPPRVSKWACFVQGWGLGLPESDGSSIFEPLLGCFEVKPKRDATHLEGKPILRHTIWSCLRKSNPIVFLAVFLSGQPPKGGVSKTNTILHVTRVDWPNSQNFFAFQMVFQKRSKNSSDRSKPHGLYIHFLRIVESANWPRPGGRLAALHCRTRCPTAPPWHSRPDGSFDC